MGLGCPLTVFYSQFSAQGISWYQGWVRQTSYNAKPILGQYLALKGFPIRPPEHPQLSFWLSKSAGKEAESGVLVTLTQFYLLPSMVGSSWAPRLHPPGLITPLPYKPGEHKHTICIPLFSLPGDAKVSTRRSWGWGRDAERRPKRLSVSCLRCIWADREGLKGCQDHLLEVLPRVLPPGQDPSSGVQV